MSGELSEFEQKSALVPKNTPYGILGGFVLAFIIFVLIATFGKNEAVDEIDQKAEAAESAPAAAPSGGGEVDDI